MTLSLLEAARRAYLLVLCQRNPGGQVSRGYLKEKVTTIYQCTEVGQIRNLLDLPSRTEFNNILDESHAPVKP